MALVGRTQLGMKEFGNWVTVPNNPKAKLMYYLDCICTVLQLDDEGVNINRLKDYNNYRRLTDEETDLLIMLCGLALKPDNLINKCIFKNDAMCRDWGNKFYELSAVSDRLLVAGSVMIGGRTKRVSKIMTFKISWLENYWIEPMKALIREQENKRAASARARRREESSGCAVM